MKIFEIPSRIAIFGAVFKAEMKYVVPHHACRIDEAGGILHEYPFISIRIIAGPYFVEISECTIIYAGATGRAALHDNVGVFGADPLHDAV